MSDTTCPKCGATVPEPMTASRGGTGDPPSFQPWRQHAECPGCGETLVRQKEPGPGHDWQLKR